MYEAAGNIRCGSATDDRCKFPKLDQSKYSQQALPVGDVWSIRHMRWYKPRSVEDRYRQDKKCWFDCDTEEKKAEWLALEWPPGVLSVGLTPLSYKAHAVGHQPLAQHTGRCTGVAWRGTQQWIAKHRHGIPVHDPGAGARRRSPAAQAPAAGAEHTGDSVVQMDGFSLAGGCLLYTSPSPRD